MIQKKTKQQQQKNQQLKWRKESTYSPPTRKGHVSARADSVVTNALNSMFCHAVGSLTNAVPAAGPDDKYPSKPFNSGCNAATLIDTAAVEAALNAASSLAEDILLNATIFFAMVMRGPSATIPLKARLLKRRTLDRASIFKKKVVLFLNAGSVL